MTQIRLAVPLIMLSPFCFFSQFQFISAYVSVTRVMLHWKLLYLAKQRELFFSEEENTNRKVNERIEAGKKRHAELLLEVCMLNNRYYNPLHPVLRYIPAVHNQSKLTPK